MQLQKIDSFHLLAGGSYKTLYTCSLMPQSRSSWVAGVNNGWDIQCFSHIQSPRSSVLPFSLIGDQGILMLWLVSSRHFFIISLTLIMCFVNFSLPFSFLHLTYILSPISYNLYWCFFAWLIICSSSLLEALLVFSLNAGYDLI